MEYRKVTTSAEVWAVIKAKHGKDLVVFSSFSDPDGTFCGGSGGTGRMETAYGFVNADYPIMEAKTTWEISLDQPHKRINEAHEYWLCLPIKCNP